MTIQGVEFKRQGEWKRPFGPDDVFGYSEEVKQAMKLLEPLLQANLLAVHPDRWNAGRLCFLRPRVAKLQGWTPHVPWSAQKPSLWRVGGVKNLFRNLF